MRILERVELDKPIIMHDKLDVIWDFENDNINHYEVKKDLEDLKVRRMAQNNKQFRAYLKILEFIERRVEPCSRIDKLKKKISMHEKEREFLDCLRIIIRNGYELTAADIKDVLNFIAIQEILLFDEADQ